jgi:hypothetical protein
MIVPHSESNGFFMDFLPLRRHPAIAGWLKLRLVWSVVESAPGNYEPMTSPMAARAQSRL